MKFLSEFCVLLMILLSGSIRLYLEFSVIFVPVLLFLSGILFLKYGDRHSSYNLRLLSILLIIPLINIVFINPHLESNLVYVCLMFVLSGFFIISSFDFENFRVTWIKYVRWLCLVSIIIQICHDYGGLPAGSIDVRGCNTTLYFFNCDWGEHRLSSIYWEPGQFQIILIFTLCLFTDKFGIMENKQKWLKEWGVIILALLMTVSTTGYLAFIILLSGLLFSSYRFNARKTHRHWIFFIPVFVIMFALWKSDAVQEKVEQSEDTGNQHTSAAIRIADNIALYNVTMDSPFVGYGIDTYEQNRKKDEYGSITSSNGWLYASSAFGLIYVGLILLLMYRRVSYMPRVFPSFIIWLSLFISQCDEYIIFFPYIYLYLFKFQKSR